MILRNRPQTGTPSLFTYFACAGSVQPRALANRKRCCAGGDTSRSADHDFARLSANGYGGCHLRARVHRETGGRHAAERDLVSLHEAASRNCYYRAHRTRRQVTAFTLAASLEYGAHARGGSGLFSWWSKLPYWNKDNWLFPYLFCGLAIFIFGGITGIINASYAMNGLIHNTAWLPAHFHLTVGGPVFLGILGMSLFLITGILKKPVAMKGHVLAVPYVWTLGTFIFSTGFFWGGLRGEPRRTNVGLTYLNPASPSYRPDWHITTHIGMIGGCIMGLAILMYFTVLIRSLLSAPDLSANIFKVPMSEAYHDEEVSGLRNFTPWVAAAVLLVGLAYYVPIRDIVRSGYAPAVGYSPNSRWPIKKPPETNGDRAFLSAAFDSGVRCEARAEGYGFTVLKNQLV